MWTHGCGDGQLLEVSEPPAATTLSRSLTQRERLLGGPLRGGSGVPLTCWGKEMCSGHSKDDSIHFIRARWLNLAGSIFHSVDTAFKSPYFKSRVD